ncbi:unnamed protein product [Spirodela intermedia]|uniref:Uncharacterized protein n=1 Tax=Spirodela intermedia TaxID=51605 RepID=A0A7I8JCZ9_SPIIN|nr:unnamed protein product [Spirodela intermedia]CAA6668034.1 unnamed protein product [Spirodela intermedia]
MSRSSGTIPAGRDQSKWQRRPARASSTSQIAKFIPGHILLPAPNGRNWKSIPRKSAGGGGSSRRNLSGRNSSGTSHHSGSVAMA